MKILRLMLVLMMLGTLSDAMAGVQASLNRDSIALGDSVTLTIASDASDAPPDLAPLRADFDVRGTSTSSQTSIANGSMRSVTQWSIELVPRKSGVIDIPALTVGRERTQPLRVGVNAQQPAQASAQTGGGAAPVFIETTVDPANPYVQQAMVYTERLYYAVTLLNGALDAPKPDNGDARQIGTDTTNSVMLQGHRYNVLERRYLLQPERSGAMHIPGPGFQGLAMGDSNDVFDRGAATRAVGKQLDVQVRARPPQANGSWLPAHAIAIVVDPLTPPVHAGEPFSIVVRLEGEGVSAVQLPEIALPSIPGAQVYPEPSSTAEQQRDGRLLAERSRRFAIVPANAGTLRMPEVSVSWWDVVNDRAAIAHAALPALQVLPGPSTPTDNGTHASANADNISTAPGGKPASATALRGWQIATASLAVLLALSLWWGWRRGSADFDDVEQPEDAVAHAPGLAPTLSLSRALALGDPSAIAQALSEAAPGSPARNLGEVALRLADPAQRDALLAFDAARWSADGTPSAQALAQLRDAFKQPPRWAGRTSRTATDDALPPLYPS